jgi:hypothetical protein
MAVLNLRGIPDELARQVKATAASEGKKLVPFVIEVLERDMRRGGWTAPKPAVEKEGKRRKKAQNSLDNQVTG